MMCQCIIRLTLGMNFREKVVLLGIMSSWRRRKSHEDVGRVMKTEEEWRSNSCAKDWTDAHVHESIQIMLFKIAWDFRTSGHVLASAHGSV